MLRSAFVALLLSLLAVPAQAWTRAHVREAAVVLSLEGTKDLRVSLELSVEVTGGWLERLEVPGLPSLPAEAGQVEAWLIAEDGSEATPQVHIEDEQLELRFARAVAPRRGQHRLGVRYSLPVSSGVLFNPRGQDVSGGSLALEWTLPGWEAGLSHAAIHWLLPRGAEPVRDPGVAEQITLASAPEQRSKVSFERVHVPRESPWRVVVNVPARALGLAETARVAKAPVFSGWEAWGPFALAAGAVLLLSFLARLHLRRWAAREGMQSLNLWFGARAHHAAWLALVLGALAAWLSQYALAWALVSLLGASLLLIERAQARSGAQDHRPFEPISAQALRKARRMLLRERIGIAPFQDAGSALGMLGVLACLTASWLGAGGLSGRVIPWALAVACGVVPLFAASRLNMPRSLNHRVTRLAQAAEQLRLPGVALRLVWRRSPSAPLDAPTEPRLRVMSARPHHGLLRIDVMADSRPGSCALTLCAVVLSDSTAARALAAHWSDAVCVRSGSGKRTAFAKPTPTLERDLEQLLGLLAAHEQRALEVLVRETAREAA